MHVMLDGVAYPVASSQIGTDGTEHSFVFRFQRFAIQDLGKFCEAVSYFFTGYYVFEFDLRARRFSLKVETTPDTAEYLEEEFVEACEILGRLFFEVQERRGNWNHDLIWLALLRTKTLLPN